METYNKACELLCLPSGRYYLVDTVKDKFKNRALVSHPDKGGENSAFIQLKHAYDIVREECEKELTKKTITPEGWEQHKTKSGELCYVYHPTKRVQWLFPTSTPLPPPSNSLFTHSPFSYDPQINTVFEDVDKRYQNVSHMYGVSQPTFNDFLNDLCQYNAYELKYIARFHGIKGYYKMDRTTLEMKLTDLYKKKHSI
jgi:hypothetical protein